MEASPDVNVFLFTDIEGSTSKWETEHDRMAQAVALHDAILRGAVEGRRGRVIKTTGDGVYAMFADAEDAVQAVVSFQLALARSGSHGRHRDPRALRPARGSRRRARQRLLRHDDQPHRADHGRGPRRPGAAVRGGRRPHPRRTCRAELSLRELGAVRLKDLAAPEHVYQLVHPELRARLPAAALARGAAQQPAAAAHLVRRPGARARRGEGAPGEDAPAHAARHGRSRQDAAVAADRRRPARRVSRTASGSSTWRRSAIRRSSRARRRRCSACARSRASRCCRRCARTSSRASCSSSSTTAST